jgi:uncharacterized membrane protein
MYEEWSSDWVSLSLEIARMEEDIQQQKEDALYEAMMHEQMIQDNMYARGAMSTEEYIAVLQRRLRGLEEFSDEWTQIWQQIEAIQEEAITQQDRVNEWLFGRGDVGEDEYLAYLYDRLAGMEQFSDEWMQTIDKIESIEQASIADQDRIMEYRYSSQEIDSAEYLRYLRAKLVGLEQYSEEWIQIMGAIQSVESDSLREAQELQQKRLALGEISTQEYLNYLKAQLAGYEKYSDEWMALHDEIESIEESSADKLKSWADSISDALKNAFDEVVDPIKNATSLLAAFGDQSNITMDQVKGFYDHMKAGTARWVDVIRGLKDAGLNPDMLKQLIAAGPQSLSYAESLLGLGGEGISFINQSMSEIDALAAGLGNEIATASVGTLIQTQTNLSVDVGGIEISMDIEGTTITIADVQAAITAAIGQLATSIVTSH